MGRSLTVLFLQERLSAFFHKLFLKTENKYDCQKALPSGSVVKSLPEVQEMQDRSLGQEDPLEEQIAACSSILAGKIPWTEEPGGLQFMGSQRARHN